MVSISLDETSEKLRALVAEIASGEEILLTEGDTPVARIVPLRRQRRPRIPGSAKGIVLHIAEDFDAAPEGFEEYLP